MGDGPESGKTGAEWCVLAVTFECAYNIANQMNR